MPARVALIIAVWHILAAAAFAQTVSWIKLGRGPVYEVANEPGRGDGPNEVTVPIPLAILPGIKPEDVTLKLLDARLGNRYMQGLAEAFTVGEKVSAATGRGPFMSVKVDFSKATAQGNYNLLIEAATPSQSSPQSLDIQIARPAAKLKSQPTFIIERVLSPFSAPDLSDLSTTLGEDGGLTRVTDIKAEARDFFGGEGQVIGGKIKCPSPPAVIAPGGSAELKYELSGDFPIGTSRGTVEIRSPQLAEALPIAFEVRTRRARWLILVIIVMGLLTGYLLRTLLQQRIKLGETRLRGIDLRDRMRLERKRRPDETFQNRLDAAVDKLASALDAGDADKLAKAIDDADVELRAGLKHFEDRRNKAQENLDSFEKVVKTRWDIPGAVSEAVAAAGMRVEGLRAELLGDNVKTVEDGLAEARTVLDDGLRRTLGEWRNKQQTALESLDVHFLPASVSAALSNEVTATRTLLDNAAGLKKNPTLDDISAALEATHNARARLSDLFGKLRHRLQYESGEFLKTLRRTKVPNDAGLNRLEQAVTDFTNELAAVEPDDAAVLLTLTRLSELDAAWRDALEKQLDGPQFSDEERAKVAPLLNERKYTDAARAAYVILEQKRKKTLGVARREMADPVVAAEVAAPPADPAWAGVGAPPMPASLAPRVPRAEQMPSPLEPILSHTYSELLWAKSLQFVMAGLLIALAGYLLFEVKFVGTFADMAVIFLWGFGLDVTADTVLRIRQKD
jgi:hypothetical protein